MSQIENLSHCQFMIGIEQDDLIGQTALRQRVGKSGTHSAGANNHYLSWFPCVTHNSVSFGRGRDFTTLEIALQAVRIEVCHQVPLCGLWFVASRSADAEH